MLRSSTDRAPSAPTTGRPAGCRSPNCTNTEAWSQYRCSCASLSPSNCTTTSIATSTRFPVGGMPGNIQSIGIVWVNRATISSTSLPWPMVRDRDHLHIRRDLRQEIFGVKLVQFFLAIAADHHRYLVDAWVR